MESAPQLANHGYLEWNLTPNTDSLDFDMCELNSCTHELFARSHHRMDAS